MPADRRSFGPWQVEQQSDRSTRTGSDGTDLQSPAPQILGRAVRAVQTRAINPSCHQRFEHARLVGGRAERRDNLRPAAEHDLASSYRRSTQQRSRA